MFIITLETISIQLMYGFIQLISTYRDSSQLASQLNSAPCKWNQISWNHSGQIKFSLLTPPTLLLRSTAKARTRLAAIYCLVKESCVWKLVLDTFRISSAERVPSKCSQSRYIADIFHKDICKASSNILPI